MEVIASARLRLDDASDVGHARRLAIEWSRKLGFDESKAGNVAATIAAGAPSRWKLDESPGLSARGPLLVAAVLYRDYQRDSDDATVVALRDGP